MIGFEEFCVENGLDKVENSLKKDLGGFISLNLSLLAYLV